jgi:hypothetical protein
MSTRILLIKTGPPNNVKNALGKGSWEQGIAIKRSLIRWLGGLVARCSPPQWGHAEQVCGEHHLPVVRSADEKQCRQWQDACPCLGIR